MAEPNRTRRELDLRPSGDDCYMIDIEEQISKLSTSGLEDIGKMLNECSRTRRLVAEDLDVDIGEVENTDNPGYEMIKQWTKQKGDGATLFVLRQILEHRNLGAIVGKLDRVRQDKVWVSIFVKWNDNADTNLSRENRHDMNLSQKLSSKCPGLKPIKEYIRQKLNRVLPYSSSHTTVQLFNPGRTWNSPVKEFKGTQVNLILTKTSNQMQRNSEPVLRRPQAENRPERDACSEAERFSFVVESEEATDNCSTGSITISAGNLSLGADDSGTGSLDTTTADSDDCSLASVSPVQEEGSVGPEEMISEDSDECSDA